MIKISSIWLVVYALYLLKRGAVVLKRIKMSDGLKYRTSKKPQGVGVLAVVQRREGYSDKYLRDLNTRVGVGDVIGSFREALARRDLGTVMKGICETLGVMGWEIDTLGRQLTLAARDFAWKAVWAGSDNDNFRRWDLCEIEEKKLGHVIVCDGEIYLLPSENLLEHWKRTYNP
jgi:hypothetical protein